MKPYLLTEIPHDGYNAGFKAKKDIIDALGDGYIRIDVRESFRWDKIPAFFRLMRQLRRLPRGAELYMQCPIYSFFNEKFLPRICRVLRQRGIRLILILHDVDSLRYTDHADRLLPVERELYTLADRMIVHNPAMKDALTNTHGVSADKMVSLGIFDYLYDKTPAGADDALSGTVFVAGNLDPEKAGYLYQLDDLGDAVTVLAYGGNFDAARAPKNVSYQGKFPPDELPERLHGNFGLIWDGIAADSCTGATGDYLRINNPHKTSLYLAAGFPVIIWKQAAMAAFIEEHGLGLTVDSLAELPERLSALSAEDYRAMVTRVRELGEALRTGSYIRKAVEAAASHC